jgi:hypothetical protein
MKFITPIFLLFTLSSCYHVYYSPNTPNVTQLTEKNEVRINAGIISGLESDFSGGDLQLAYAPTQNVGVMVNGFTASRAESTYNGRFEKGSGKYGEFGIGYFGTFDKNKEWTFEVYGGVGGGTVSNDYGMSESSKVSINKLFIQPAVGYKWDHIELAVTTKLAHVNWKVKQLKTTDTGVNEDMLYIKYRPEFFNFEPALILRGGGKRIKGQLAITFGSMRLEEYIYEPPSESAVGYLGVSINLSRKKKQASTPLIE